MMDNETKASLKNSMNIAGLIWLGMALYSCVSAVGEIGNGPAQMSSLAAFGFIGGPILMIAALFINKEK